jgi:hypothetical protein
MDATRRLAAIRQLFIWSHGGMALLTGAGSDLLDIEVFGNEFAHPVLGLGA